MDRGWQGWLEPGVIVAMFFGLVGAGLTIFQILEGRKRAPAIIYLAIRAALDDALRATGPGAITAAQHLDDQILAYLGPLFDITSAKPIGQLRKAIGGRITDPSQPVVVVTQAHGGAAASASAAGAGSAAAATAAAGGTQVLVAPPPPPQPPVREASTREHVAEVRAALEAFDAFWTRARIEQMLRRAQQALLIKAPMPAARDPEARRGTR